MGSLCPHIRLCCHLICRASSSLLANFLGQLLHVQGKGRSPVKKEDHQWIEIPRKFSLTIDIVSNFWGQYCLKKGASQPGLLCNSYCDWQISSKLRLHNWDIHLGMFTRRRCVLHLKWHSSLHNTVKRVLHGFHWVNANWAEKVGAGFVDINVKLEVGQCWAMLGHSTGWLPPPLTHPHHRYQFSVGQKAKQIDSLL